jgi:hypothetical protein
MALETEEGENSRIQEAENSRNGLARKNHRKSRSDEFNAG